jgi:large repetitive protein
VKYSTSGNQRLDVYAFHSIARAGNYALQVRSVDTSMTVVDSAVGGTLWLDRNGNGFMDGNEPVRLTGVRVQLVDAHQIVLTSTTTDGSGAYTFPGLHSGTYTVQVVNSNGVDGASDVYPALGNSYDVDSGSINSGGHPDMKVALAKNVQRSDVVFGFATTSLSGFSWRDDNRDGLVDPGEPPVKNQTITLTGTNDLGAAVNLQTTTDNSGQFTFALLRPGTYIVATTAQPGSVLAYAGSAGGVANGIEVDNVVLAAGMTADGYNFALIAPSAKILVFDDQDGNGRQGGNEHGVAGVKTHIHSRKNLNNALTTDDQTTDATGQVSLYS